MKTAFGPYYIDFSNPEAVRGWRGINDVVMGGRSSGRAEYDPEGGLVFLGSVSFEGGGGFASIISPLMEGLRGKARYLDLTFKGDGKTYKFSLRTGASMNGISYQTRFITESGIWETRRFPVSEFRPTYHGVLLEGESPPESDRISRFGFLIADRQEGPFRLEIKSIEAVFTPG